MTVSVIMSVYNETADEFLEAVNSIRNQTFRDIEIIIIIDNPNRHDIVDAILQLNDSRIIYKKNKKNIGLANSINIAAEMSSGDYLLRMDSDDISSTDRIQKELDAISNSDYVCTGFTYIDNLGKKIERNPKYYSNLIINDLLPYVNTIHHPTVMIKKSVFNDVGGYRDFACAQDYDLWLRLYDNKFRVLFLDEKLLSYRVRENSTTSTKGLQQFYTMEYIRKLSIERRKKGIDSYSPKNYQAYLEKKGAFDPKKVEIWNKGKELRLIKGSWCYIILILQSAAYRKLVFNAIRVKFFKCLYTFQKASLNRSELNR